MFTGGLCRNVETPQYSRVSHKADISSSVDRDEAEPSKVDDDKDSSTSVLSKYATLVLFLLFCSVNVHLSENLLHF